MEVKTIDLVDENDEIIGKSTKEESHAKGLFHRITATLVLDDKGKIALQKRAKNYTGGGLLDHSAAGHISSGESYEDAALRELNEELGIKIPIQRIAYLLKELWQNRDKDDIKHIYQLFIGHHNGPFKLQESEVESVEFYDIETIKKMIKDDPEKFAEGFKVSFNEYLNWKEEHGNTN